MRSLRFVSLVLAVSALTSVAAFAQSGNKVTIRVVESIHRVVESQRGAGGNWLNMIDQFEKENPDIKVEVIDIPSTGDGSDGWAREDMMTAAGDNYDVLECSNSLRLSKYVNAGFFHPLNDLAKEAGYDMEKKFGRFLKKYNGQVLWLPDDYSANIVYYNKAIFDAAKVPYPKAGWTWDDYAAIAKKLTDAKKGIYGSLMMQWEYYTYVTPAQKNIPAYKADGTSNFDNPEYANWLKFFKAMGDSKSQPSWLDMSNKKLQWDSFMSGKFGMLMIGSWHLGLMADSKSYPRDWKFGIVAPPVPADGKGKAILANGGGFAVNRKAAHPKEAFKFVTFMVDHFADYNPDVYYARADFTEDALKAKFSKDAEKFANDGLTTTVFINAIMNPAYAIVDEKIVGPAASAINTTYTKEAEKYFLGAQTLDATVKNIKKKADEAIAKEKASK